MRTHWSWELAGSATNSNWGKGFATLAAKPKLEVEIVGQAVQQSDFEMVAVQTKIVVKLRMDLAELQ